MWVHGRADQITPGQVAASDLRCGEADSAGCGDRIDKEVSKSRVFTQLANRVQLLTPLGKQHNAVMSINVRDIGRGGGDRNYDVYGNKGVLRRSLAI